MTQYQPAQAVSNQIAFTLTEQQYAQALMRHSKGSYVLMILVGFTFTTALLATSSVWAAVASGLIGLFYWLFLTSLTRYAIRKQYRSMPQLHGVQTVQFSEEGLVWHNDYSLSRIKWPLYQKFAANDSMYMLYQAPHMFNMIPRSAFVDAEQEAAFRMVLELHVKPAGKSAPKRRRREV